MAIILECLLIVSLSCCVVVELTVDLTKYLQNCISKLCSKSKSVSELLLLLKPVNEDSSSSAAAAATPTDGQSNSTGESAEVHNDDGGRRSSISGTAGCELSDVTKWSYCTRLTDWLYHVSWGMWNGNRNKI